MRPARARVATTATRATAVDDAVAAVSQAKEAALSVLGTLPDAEAVASVLEEARAKVDLGDVDVDAALASLRATLDALSIDAFSIDALSIDAAAQALDIDPMAAWRVESAVAAAAGDEPALAGAVAAAIVAGASLAIARVAGVSGDDDASTKSTHYDGETYDGLPTVYDIPAIREYWSERPLASARRAGGLVAKLSAWALSVLSDVATGNVETNSRKRAAAMRDLISEQGPAFVKVGQAIAIRPDLLPQAYLDELQKLLDQVAPFGSDEARATIEASLGDGVTLDDVFEDAATAFAQPVAAASIGQVYKATLRPDAPGVDQSESDAWGRVVAVKVQRPDILSVVTLDLLVIRSLLEAAARIPTGNNALLQQVVQTAEGFIPVLDVAAERFMEELDYGFGGEQRVEVRGGYGANGGGPRRRQGSARLPRPFRAVRLDAGVGDGA